MRFLSASWAPSSSRARLDIPQRVIELSAFAIDREEVTVTRYRRCVAAGACKAPAPYDSKDASARACNWGRDGREAHPVNCVGIDQAWRFCLWAGKRLPTEAEWEKAARGVDGRLYPWGNNKPSCELATHYHDKRYYLSLDDSPSLPAGKDYCHEGTTPTAARTNVSPYGAVQMAGNVSEWVADWYAVDYYERCPTNDPRGPSRATGGTGIFGIGPTRSVGKAIVRGGSWADSRDHLQTTHRQAVPSFVEDSTIGSVVPPRALDHKVSSGQKA